MLKNNFKLAKFEFILTAGEDLYLPLYLGSTLRGGFGHAFKRITCCNPQRDCASCLLKEKCIYFYVFEDSSLRAGKNLKRYQGHSPHPFIIEPPDGRKQKYRPGEKLIFNLVLIGRAIDYLPYFIFAFDELGRSGIGKGRGKTELSQISSLPVNSDEPVLIYDGQSKQLSSSFQVISPTDILKQAGKYKDNKQITLNFLTPTRIKNQGKLTSQLSSDLLIVNLIRRLSALSYFHCDQKLEAGYDELIEEAKTLNVLSSDLLWHDWERYSNRQKTRMKLGGFVGKITLGGESLGKFLPLIFIGSLIHIGNGYTFGLGRYEVW